jgi:hypothetical protein
MEANTASRPSIASQLRRRLGTQKNNSSANDAPPADGQKSFLVWFIDVVAAVVLMVSVAVCAVVPLTVTVAGMLHVAGSFEAFVVNAQLRFTVPVKPLFGVTVIVEVLPVVAPGATVMAPLLATPKPGVPMFTASVVVGTSDPEVPVTVTV